MKNKLLLLTLIFFSVTSAFSQSDVVKSYINDHPNGISFYFYKSVLRVLHSEGKNGDSDYNKFIKDLDYVRFFYLGDETDIEHLSSDFLPKIKQEGYEDLIELRESGFRIRFYMKGEGEEAKFMGLVAEPTFLLIFEVEGNPNLNYMNTLSDLDLRKIKNIIPANMGFDIK